MATYTFLYRCPTTGQKVQGVISRTPASDDTGTYEIVTCPVCDSVHLVNPMNGRVLGEK